MSFMSKRKTRDRNWSHSGHRRQRDGSPQLPTFNRNAEFAAGITRLARAYEVMNSGDPAGQCNFQLKDGSPCANGLDGNHSIQEKILDRLAVKGHVKTFPRDIHNIKNRFIDEDPARRELFVVQRRWSPVDIGVNEASVWRFFCNLHDNELFRPIERNESDPFHHPLDETSLTPEQYFLLSYRILLRIREESRGARWAFEVSLTRNQLRSKPAVVLLARHSEIAKGLDRRKGLFDEHYQSGSFDSFIETPIDTIIELPIHLAVADLYQPDLSANSLFLTIYPVGPQTADGPYVHRVIATRLQTALKATASTLRSLDTLLSVAGQSESGSQSFLAGVLRPVRNAFYSRGYEQQLSEQTRIAIERQVCANVLESIRQWFPGAI